MNDPLPDFRPDDDASRIADALRAGTAVRALNRVTPGGEDEARLRELGNLEGLTTVARPGPAAPLIKSARRLMHVLVRPWLAMQTIYNRELARRFQATTTLTHDLDRRLPLVEQAMRDLASRLVHVETRLSSPSGESPHAPATADLASLCRLFVHGHLPVPPARILVAGGDAGSMPIELASFGFDVSSVGVPRSGTHSRLRHAEAVSEKLPFGEGEFAAVIWLPSLDRPETTPLSASEIARVLAPDGSLLSALRLDAGGRGAAASRLWPLTLTSAVTVRSIDGSWSVTPDHDTGADAVLLVKARPADVPGR